MNIRPITPSDHPALITLWQAVPHMGMHPVDDSAANITAFLNANPNLSYLAEANGKLLGSVLCGSDNRRATLYHMAVHPNAQRQGIATALLKHVETACRDAGIQKMRLMIFADNQAGQQFWQTNGWQHRPDIAYYSKDL